MKIKEKLINLFDAISNPVYCEDVKTLEYVTFGSTMGSFGEDLRMERLSRGIALEDITAVTKISQHLLVALEQERFRLLPGGILSKGIVRGYANAIGLDQHDWTERFLKACNASGLAIANENDWTAFAANVGKARLMRREAIEIRLRWAGAILLFVVIAAAAFFTARYYGHRAGWWHSLRLLPQSNSLSQFVSASAHRAFTALFS
jgi:cytoskeletal protein RodZ